MKKAATSTLAAGFAGAALLGLGVSAGTASAAPQQNHPQQSYQQGHPQQQREITVTRLDYRSFVYRGVRVTPRYNAAHQAWGFTYNRTFVHVVLARR